MVARVSIEQLPAEVREAIARGESVCVYDEEHLKATVVPEATESEEGLWEALAKLPPLDDDFEKDIREAYVAVIKDKPLVWE
jgi:hypothetical protein